MKRVVRVRAHLRQGRPVRMHNRKLTFSDGWRDGAASERMRYYPESEETMRALNKRILENLEADNADYAEGLEQGEEYEKDERKSTR